MEGRDKLEAMLEELRRRRRYNIILSFVGAKDGRPSGEERSSFDGLRHEPRFQELVKRMGLPA